MELMILKEAIRYAEELAEENEKSLGGWKECKNRGTVGWSDFDKEKVYTSITRCNKYAAAYRQLAEWLKDYKRLLGQQSGEPQKGNVYLSREVYGDLCFAASKWNELEICGGNSKYVRRDKTGEWIPVSERFPEDEQEILFSTKTGRVQVGKYHDDDSANQWYSYRDKCRAWNNVVTAWMPLPEPYKPTDSEKE